MSDSTGHEKLLKAKIAISEQSIPKNRTARVRMRNGGEYTFKYADLNDVISAVSGPLHESGLVLTHPVVADDKGMRVQAVITDGTGATLVSACLPLPNNMPDPQALGSLLTYYKRYLTYCVLGIHPDEDDDGAAMKRAEERKKRPPFASDKAKGGAQPQRTARREQEQSKVMSGAFTATIDKVERHGEVYVIHVKSRTAPMHSLDTTVGAAAEEHAGTGAEVRIAFRMDDGQPIAESITPVNAPEEAGA